MTDLEMTRLCAEAMGVWHCRDSDTHFVGQPPLATVNTYSPIHDDAQAMALVKRFGLHITCEPGLSQWRVVSDPGEGDTTHPNLNRAIVECVAKMQEAKHG